jgi:hypothetical protein
MNPLIHIGLKISLPQSLNHNYSLHFF